jgi:hypothetical protein
LTVALLLIASNLGWANMAANSAVPLQRVVFGSFSTATAAQSWSATVAIQLALATEVLASSNNGNPRFRVVSEPLTVAAAAKAERLARAQQWPTWSYRASIAALRPAAVSPATTTVTTTVTTTATTKATTTIATVSPTSEPTNTAGSAKQRHPNRQVQRVTPVRADDSVHQEFDLDVGLQSRSYVDAGNTGQDRWQVSTSIALQWQRSWRDGQRSVTATPFLRVDSQDSERTHFDMRELFVSAIGNTWELHVGARRLFWGVTEFHHLVDVINQTDLVENIDTEDKLGQPMVQLSLVRDWGILDFMLLPGFRERTFPGHDGRLRALLPINTKRASYASAAAEHRVDGAVRWSHTLAGVDFGLYHFSGTNRDPQLRVVTVADNNLELRPHYTTIDQTGVDAQVNWGDWAFKLEAISRSGDGERYAAANLGLERTVVGAFGTRGDMGLVLEYMFDERGEEATNTLFEQDLAVGMRWQVNDLYDSQALLGVIWDTKSDEVMVSLEANRRLGEHWQLALEGRVFAGAHSPEQQPLLVLLDDPMQKTAALQRDDFLQLELTRFF